MTSRVALVTGSLPPAPCGIGDYTERLASALEKAGQPVEIICHRRWDALGTLEINRQLRRSNASILHFQYPTLGYGYSLGPHLCAFATGSIVTLHEFSAAHLARKMSVIPLTLRAPRVVMTSEFEARILASRMPWLRNRLKVIPIGSNIASLTYNPDESLKRIVYFGLIMPNKGIEDFIEFSRVLAATRPEVSTAIIGKVPPRHSAYARRLMEASQFDSVEWLLDRDAEDVSHLLSASTLSYLPFPDGASERRGSLKAVCSIGLPCITTNSADTPATLANAVLFASTPADAAGCALRLLADESERRRISQAAREYAQSFSWERIADFHIQMYREAQASGAGLDPWLH